MVDITDDFRLRLIWINEHLSLSTFPMRAKENMFLIADQATVGKNQHSASLSPYHFERTMLSELASLSHKDIFQGYGSKISVSGATRKLDPLIVKTVEGCLAPQKRPVFLLEETIDSMVKEIRTTSRDTTKLLSKLERSLEIVSASQKQMLDLQEKLLVLKERPVAHIPSLPMEIARHIFLLSAEDGQQQWGTLSLVSSQVQRWCLIHFSFVTFLHLGTHLPHGLSLHGSSDGPNRSKSLPTDLVPALMRFLSY
ncbi:hypothetical protein DL96DRAFT_191403 [Flagelloscypha sp. PMI_526]|nr:hypothetical protein DL96DRAFT_191403 [Flagelloscypha sp. PMI_526]